MQNSETVIEMAQKISSIPNEDFTIFGVLLLIITFLIFALVYYVRKNDKLVNIIIDMNGEYKTMSANVINTLDNLKNFIMR